MSAAPVFITIRMLVFLMEEYEMTNLMKRAAFRLVYGLMIVAAMLMMGAAAVASAQQASTAQAKPSAGLASSVETKSATPTPAVTPVFTAYRGVGVGLNADEVRQKLGKPEEKFDDMDLFVLSEKERARVYYDKDKKARAISVTYIGTNGGAPTPLDVLGTEIETKADGSMHHLIRYPEAGYWVSYNRTAGENPLVMVTMQKIP
jgi:hypothetical protein